MRQRKDEKDTTTAWDQFQKGKEFYDRISLVDNVQKANRFYEGDQWGGIESDGEELPMFNIISPIVDYKTAMVAMNEMSITYSSMNFGDMHERLSKVADIMTRYANKLWERNKMNTVLWDMVKNACIDGDSYLFFYDKDGSVQIINSTNIMLADETSKDIQNQKYILIYERRFVEDVKKEAKENGLSQAEIENIVADGDDSPDQNTDDVQADKKCSCITKLEKKSGALVFSKSTKTVVYKPETVIDGLDKYTIANYVWKEKRNLTRVTGEVTPLISNQIAINKNLARRIINSKITAFAKMVADVSRIDNAEDLDKVGSIIQVRNTDARAVNSIIGYLNPAPISADAKNLTDELIARTRDLANASEAVTGSVDPTKASGAAIIAVKDQASIPLNQQVAGYKQLVEDVARIWFSLWVAYNPNGMEIELEENGEIIQETISADELSQMQIDVKVDVSPSNPFSKYAREQSVERLFQMKAISFEEYVDMLDELGNVPKGKLQAIIAKRQEMQAQAQAGAQVGGQAVSDEEASLQQSIEAKLAQLGGGPQVVSDEEAGLQQSIESKLEQLGQMQGGM